MNTEMQDAMHDIFGQGGHAMISKDTAEAMVKAGLVQITMETNAGCFVMFTRAGALAYFDN
jgi:hypothetical protein